ncbi:hypothetical protein GCM10022221_68250 [Actinocorallia aurea]
MPRIITDLTDDEYTAVTTSLDIHATTDSGDRPFTLHAWRKLTDDGAVIPSPAPTPADSRAPFHAAYADAVAAALTASGCTKVTVHLEIDDDGTPRAELHLTHPAAETAHLLMWKDLRWIIDEVGIGAERPLNGAEGPLPPPEVIAYAFERHLGIDSDQEAFGRRLAAYDHGTASTSQRVTVFTVVKETDGHLDIVIPSGSRGTHTLHFTEEAAVRLKNEIDDMADTWFPRPF